MENNPTIRAYASSGSGVCRCCMSDGPVVTMIQTVSLNRPPQVTTYADLLRTCYNLDIIESDKELNCDTKQVICERCISSLTNAYTFRTQVETCMQAFREQLMFVGEYLITKQVICERCISSLTNAYTFRTQVETCMQTFREQLMFVDVKKEVKVEFVAEDRREDSPAPLEMNENKTIEPSGIDPLKQSENTKVQMKYVKEINSISPAKERPSRTKVCKIYNMESTSSSTNLTEGKSDITEKLKKRGKTSKSNVAKPKTKEINVKDEIKTEPKDEDKITKYGDELTSLRRDCMDYYFFKYSQSKYKCVVCNETFAEVDDFKTHTRKHTDKSMEFLFKYKSIWDLKIDISSMKCRHCGELATDLEAFRNHLSDAHNIKSKDVFNRMMPYNLNKDEVKCVICKEVFMYMVKLNMHMKQHCGSYMCSYCSVFFPNLGRLKLHIKCYHSKETFPCKHCDKTFENTTKRHYHNTIEHNMKRWNVCQYCNEKFKSHYNKIVHLAKVHNKELKNFKCKSCPEKFTTSGMLSLHFRNVHLEERNNVCSVCGKAFFRNSALTKHMIKHTGERKYRCEVCNKSYGRPYTLREHMKIHNNERNHICQFCGRAFVAKCSLKSHLNLHKNETLIN